MQLPLDGCELLLFPNAYDAAWDGFGESRELTGEKASLPNRKDRKYSQPRAIYNFRLAN